MTTRDVSITLINKGNRALLDRVNDDVFDNPVRREYLDTFLDSPDNILLAAVCDGTVVGMASGIFYMHPDKPLQLFVNEVGVADAFQRRGIGAQLLARMLNEAKLRGCTEAWVATEENNAAARALYRSADGAEDPDKAVVYTWSLSGDQ